MAPYERVKGFGRRGGVRRKLIELKVMLAHCKPFKDLGLNVCFGNEQDWVFFDKVIKGEAPLPRHIIVEAREIGACYRDLVQQQQSGEQSLAELVTAPEALVCLLCEESFVCGRPALQHATCGLLVHPVCLAREFLRSVAKSAKADADHLLRPQSGACPLCDVDLVWAELVRNAATILTTQTLTVASSANVDEDAGVQQEQQEEEEEEEEQLDSQGEVFEAQGDDELERNEDADARGEEYDAMNDDANVIARTNANSAHEIGVSEDPPLLA
ncbi:Structure-specific endonuclease subunit SLX1-like [Hondaea fermentalgiana]|uniref:Structure-specific endonuclease subunit SLX1-like n=1 Tax=Hondaea fermentalgiana TaxID=2315210 RepID=A0A2R5GE80_9STRA|nr:Structure-specific endonuclease subunit SLX1-like [Hondaea fermentalgiana]|eukprot:GBG29240.1 Structure-specific endonuclease subunit SLX1-like [Hondaea fermentalgiana]